MKEKVILRTNFPKLNFVKSGKVRDIYNLGENFLIISTDRLSAFDVIMGQGRGRGSGRQERQEHTEREYS